MVSFVADEDRGQRRFADTTISRHNNPAWFSARASCRGIFHTCMSFNQSLGLTRWTSFTVMLLNKLVSVPKTEDLLLIIFGNGVAKGCKALTINIRKSCFIIRTAGRRHYLQVAVMRRL